MGLAWHSRIKDFRSFGGDGGGGVLSDTDEMDDNTLFTLLMCSGEGLSSHFRTTNLGGF